MATQEFKVNRLIPLFQDILAVDLSPAMLSVIQERYGAAQPTLGNDTGEVFGQLRPLC